MLVSHIVVVVMIIIDIIRSGVTMTAASRGEGIRSSSS